MSEPPIDVRRELEAILQEDDSRVGQVYRLTADGLGPPEIARELGVSTSGFVSNARTMARALLEGHVPSGPAAAQQVLSFVRRVAKSRKLSNEARSYLYQQIAELSEAVSGEPGRSSPAEKMQLHKETSSSAATSARSLRWAVEDELRRRARELAQQIKDATGIDPVDYWGVTTSSSPLDVVVRLVRTAGEEGTFQKLAQLRRLDLSLEAAVLTWAEDLPLQRNLVEDAEAKKAWFS